MKFYNKKRLPSEFAFLSGMVAYNLVLFGLIPAPGSDLGFRVDFYLLFLLGAGIVCGFIGARASRVLIFTFIGQYIYHPFDIFIVAIFVLGSISALTGFGIFQLGVVLEEKFGLRHKD